MNANHSVTTRQCALATLHEASDALLHLHDIKTTYPGVLTVMEPGELDHLTQVLKSELAKAARRLPEDEAAFFLRHGAERADCMTAVEELEHILSASGVQLMIGGHTRDILHPRTLDEIAEPVQNALRYATTDTRNAKIRIHYLQYNWCFAPEAGPSSVSPDGRRHRQMLKLYWRLMNDAVAVEAAQPITSGSENMRLTMAYIALRVVVHVLRLLPKEPERDEATERPIQVLLRPFLLPTEGSPFTPFDAEDLRAVREADAVVAKFVADARTDEYQLTRTEEFCIWKLRQEINARRYEIEQHFAQCRLAVNDAADIRTLCARGESQEVEFKSASVEPRNLVKEAVAMMNTRNGGVILVGVNDNGTISGIASFAEFAALVFRCSID